MRSIVVAFASVVFGAVDLPRYTPERIFHVVNSVPQASGAKLTSFAATSDRIHFLLNVSGKSRMILTTDADGKPARVRPVRVSGINDSWLGATDGGAFFLRRVERDQTGLVERLFKVSDEGDEASVVTTREGFLGCTVLGQKVVCFPSRDHVQIYDEGLRLIGEKRWESENQHSAAETKWLNRIWLVSVEPSKVVLVHRNSMEGYVIDINTLDRSSRSFAVPDLVALRESVPPERRKDQVIFAKAAAGPSQSIYALVGRFNPLKGAEVLQLNEAGRQLRAFYCQMGAFNDEHKRSLNPEGVMAPALFQARGHALYFADSAGAITKCAVK